MGKEFKLYTGQIVKEQEDGSFKLYEDKSDETGTEIKHIFDLLKIYDDIVKSVKNNYYLI